MPDKTRPDLINREAAIALIEQKQKELCPLGNFGRYAVYGTDRDRFDAWDEIIDQINALPDIDAAPVVHGRWIWNPEYCKWICSECRGREGECEAPICKWCGARMDGGEDDG